MSDATRWPGPGREITRRFACWSSATRARAHRLALRVLRDEEQARDAVQDAFLKVYSNLARFEKRSSFFTWLYRLVKNVCLDC